MIIKVTLIGGTHSDDDDWWTNDSEFNSFLASHSIIPAKEREFRWSTDLNGIDIFNRLFRKKKFHSDWEAGGTALSYYLENLPYEDRNIISHSHGRQVVLYAAGFCGTRINRWIDLSGPVRSDMREISSWAERNISYSMHVYSNWDYTQILGSLFDGKLGVNTECPISANLKLPHEVGHSGILTPAYRHLIPLSVLVE